MAVGGDGTISEVVNGIFQQNQIPSQEILFTAIPTGTGNDWARHHNIPTSNKEIFNTVFVNPVAVAV